MKIPQAVLEIIQKLNQAGFEAYAVGGCVRDLLMGETPGDWDVTTNAKPEEIQKGFPDSFYENQFGTVGVKTQHLLEKDAGQAGSDDESLKVVEITTYRIESKYSDKRHPDEIKFTDHLEEDLKRRDFTINALALAVDGKVIDLFNGQADLKKKIIRAVGEPGERFSEDALRMMRAIRLAAVLDFTIEPETLAAIKKHSGLLKMIAKERVRDELTKTVLADKGDRGIELLREAGLLEHVMPELLEGVGVGQNLHHIYEVWEHNLRALRYACEKKYTLAVRLASLLHDVGKPRSKRGEGYNSTFYGHEVIGARMTAQIMDRLKFPRDLAEKIIKLVRYHLFYYNVGEVTESSVRRLVANIGKENVEDLLKVREADRIGSGTPKAVPYKLRHLKFMIDKVARDPISPKMLKLNGNDLMQLLGIAPGPKVGMIISALMEEVLDDPVRNQREYLEQRTRELDRLSEAELEALAQTGKQKMSEKEEKEIKKIKEKHFVE